uniref:Uncharacterized protein n=1 Tax=Anguilla anguilla TaxID=7936 RepID=A0A0E9RI40_ANGAN
MNSMATSIWDLGSIHARVSILQPYAVPSGQVIRPTGNPCPDHHGQHGSPNLLENGRRQCSQFLA